MILHKIVYTCACTHIIANMSISNDLLWIYTYVHCFDARGCTVYCNCTAGMYFRDTAIINDIIITFQIDNAS